MNYPKNITLCIFMGVVFFSTACGKWTSEQDAEHAGKDLPEFLLKDPRGKTYSKKDILTNGAIFVVTAPVLSNKKEQEEWAECLMAAKHKGKGRLIFLQDMSPSYFKEAALSEMKKQSDPDEDPLLLIDPTGQLRKKLGVEKENTIVLVYDEKGRRIHEERGKPTRKNAFRIWGSLE